MISPIPASLSYIGPGSPRGSSGTGLVLIVVGAKSLILRTDEDLNAMYLTDKKNGSPRGMHEHDELEVLLEFFSKQVEEIVNEAENIEVCYTGRADTGVSTDRHHKDQCPIHPGNCRAHFRLKSQRTTGFGP